MATVDEAVRPKIRPRKIIERPRLMRLLEGSKARILLLVAPAGYGKTTLAEQWAARPDRRVGWVRCRRSASDIAVISRLIATAGASVLPACGRRFEQRLSVTGDPSREVDVLAEILCEDLADWPSDAWIAIDDYHHTMEAVAAERFVELVARQSPVRFLIASRDRPSWAATRDSIYGDVLSLTQDQLAMDQAETAAVTAGSNMGRSDLLEMAGGWPAVIGLSSLLDVFPGDTSSLASTLSSFFAEEVFSGLPDTVKSCLEFLALVPSADSSLVERVAGAVGGQEAFAEACRTGLVEQRSGLFHLHPLAAQFFSSRSLSQLSDNASKAVCLAFKVFVERGDWDSALEVFERHRCAGEPALFLQSALNPLLNSARLPTVERWIAVSPQDNPFVQVARAEVALRRGSHLKAQSLADLATETSGEDIYVGRRALLVAGRAAHAGSREDAALRFFKAALDMASTSEDRIEALHGLVIAAAALELHEAHDYLRDLERLTSRPNPYQAVRLIDRQMSLGFRFGVVQRLSDAREAMQLLPELNDPLARCSFLSMFACGLVLAADYESAVEVAKELQQEAIDYRLDLVLPYSLATAAAASAGRRDFVSAHELLDQAASASHRCQDQFGSQNAYAIRMRVLAQEGRAADACAIEPPDIRSALPSMRGEVIASRGLALSCLGRLDDARDAADAAATASCAIEARVLSCAIHAICDVRGRSSEIPTTVQALVDVAFESGAVDLAVTAYRGCPDLLGAMLSLETTRDRAVFMLGRSGDEELGTTAGSRPSDRLRPDSALSKREREVCDLVCQGLSNHQIAALLFISPETVKAHLHRIYDKVGVRSRASLSALVRHDTFGGELR